MSGKLIATYVFGSVGRAEQDELSDLDVLAVVEDGSGLVNESVVLAAVPEPWLHLKPSISWYGRRRLAQMFANGELFAWHLFAESIPIIDPGGFLNGLGRPSPYTDSAADMASFASILGDIPGALARSSANAVYEAGVLYVCLRNIGMAASAALAAAPDFSRYSIFNLPNALPCPLTRLEFEITMRARMAGQRGLAPPSEATATWVLSLYERISPWLNELMQKVEPHYGR